MQRDDPAAEVAPAHRRPACVGDPMRERRLVGPRADRLGQIHVRVGIRRHRPRDPRQRLHQVLLVRGREQRVRRRGELAHHQPPARPSHPRHLSQACGVVDDVAQPEADRHRIEHPVGERQPRRVAGDLGHVAARSRGQHADREVRGHTPRAGRRQLHRRHRGACGQIQHLVTGADAQRRAGGAPPEPVLSERQHGVGQVVAPGDPVEHRRDFTRVLVQRRPVHARDATCELPWAGNG